MMTKYMLLLGILLFQIHCAKDSKFPLENTVADPLVMVFAEEKYNQLFTRSGNGWTGGNGAYSIKLPDDRILWLFGASFLDTVYQDRSRPPDAKWIMNTFVLEEQGQLKTMHGGTRENPEALITPPDSAAWYLPLSGLVVNHQLEILAAAYRTIGTGVFDFELVGLDLLSFSLPEISLVSTLRLFDEPLILFGSCIYADSDYTYIYGTGNGYSNGIVYIARVPTGSLTQPWHYYHRDGWVIDVEEACPIWVEVTDQFSVFQYNGDFYLLTQPSVFEKEILLYRGRSPIGPWNNPKIIYHTLEAKNNVFISNALVHRHLGNESELIISYNVNSFDANEKFRNAEHFRPRFLRVVHWED
jgi:hypothetical protein